MAQETQTFEEFSAQMKSLDQDDLKAIVSRRHPEYDEHCEQWSFLEATYNGGREWFQKNIYRYVKEGEKEYADRLNRAYRFNHTREVVDLVNKYIFKGDIVRAEDASPEVKGYWKQSTKNRRSIQDFMDMIAKQSSIFGRVWICVDSNQETPNASAFLAEDEDARVYGYTIKPNDVLDLAYDKDGKVGWVIVREYVRNDISFTSSGDVSVQYRIWTRNFWALIKEVYTKKGKDTELTYEVSDIGEHGLGRVPVFPHDHTQSDNPYVTIGLIDDIAYLDRAVANYLSNLDAIIQDQTFSQLVMPAQGLMPGDDEEAKLLELGTKRIFTYDGGQGGSAPQYISPDASQANVILDVISKIINEIYHSVGMAGERTKQDNSMGIDNSSGVAKAYDFDRMNAMLAAKARSLQSTENTLCEIVDLWYGKDVEQGSYELVVYPDTFDIRGLADELDLAKKLKDTEAPDVVRAEQMTAVIDKLFPNLSTKLIEEMKATVKKDWPPEPVVKTPAGQSTPQSSNPKPAKESRQGQVTKDTPK